ncbi:MAG: membrane protein [Bdellovibrio sp. ArHS]|uniref:mevalonate kinase family protein n=1 Tax=Bdellovibrio sp. ArHS TaxID=1569284 RepID=UPI0005830553|nr:membrane protein [Bdellovibrio sp. ArHS]KHD89969.1 MAG: membrane protein [Bdellovibrio sp. ArHS]
MSIDFTCKSFGKWILAGEHAVLRGVPALVFPIQSRNLELNYSRTESPLELRLVGDHGKDLQLLVWGVLEKACELKKIPRHDIKGVLLLESSIPVGAGMGASAALCVALTRWLGYLGYVPESEYYEFARDLENLFHGESSGVDIAVALSGEGLYFVRNGERKPLASAWKPRWYISYSGKRGVTVDAVNKVKDLLLQNPEVGEKIDQQMAHAVTLAQKALQMDSREGLPLLAQAIEEGGQCFEQWGLNEGAPGLHIQWLKEKGALAVKPTGSGGGGYVLSLWEQEPAAEVLEKLIPC